MAAIWVYTLDVGHDEQACWYWTKSSMDVVESADGFRTFEACLANARRFGFDFDQPYHITASRQRLRAAVGSGAANRLD